MTVYLLLLEEGKIHMTQVGSLLLSDAMVEGKARVTPDRSETPQSTQLNQDSRRDRLDSVDHLDSLAKPERLAICEK